MKRDFSALASTHFDLLICGGGIYGAWTAYDAALRGLKVALVEQGDWASATSSASSKLIHGGLRYLEAFDFKLVKKALNERAMLLKAAPHRVWPLRFGVPVYEDSRIGRLKMKAGLTLYDLLARDADGGMQHRYFRPAEFARRFPILAQEGLLGGFTYADAQTDDARLVLELVAGAMDAGAVCVNYCKLLELKEAHGKAVGATLWDSGSATTLELRARQTVYATGQWLREGAESRSWCNLSRGIHLVMPSVPGEEALLLTAQSDGRVFFVIPWYGRTLVGTTDNAYHGDVAHVDVEKAEVEYLLRAANHYLKTQWTENDVIGSYAGLRVLQPNGSSSLSAASRDWELKTSRNGVLYSVGGKLTSAREDASAIVDEVCARNGVKAACPTKGRAFPWMPDDFTTWTANLIGLAQKIGVDAECTRWLIRRHGKRARDILRTVEADPSLAERVQPELPFIYADMLFCARREMVLHLEDLLRRRLPLLILTRLAPDELRRIATRVAETLGWDEARLQQELAAVASRGVYANAP